MLTGVILAAGGWVSAICHGPAALLGLPGPGGAPLLDGRQVTAFSRFEEELRGLQDIVPFDLEAALVREGAKFDVGPDRTAHVVVDDHLITGQSHMVPCPPTYRIAS